MAAARRRTSVRATPRLWSLVACVAWPGVGGRSDSWLGFGGGRTQRGPDVDESAEDTPSRLRRLEQHIERRLAWQDASADEFEAAGLLPNLHSAGLRLQEVYMTFREAPWTIKRVVVPQDFQASERTRRLQGLLDAASFRPLINGTGRDLVRALAVLAASASPEGVAAFNQSFLLSQAYEVYRQGLQVFGPVESNLTRSEYAALKRYFDDLGRLNSTGPLSTAPGGNVSIGQAAEIRMKDALMLEFARRAIRKAAGDARLTTTDSFLGTRQPPCKGLPETSAGCPGDVGVSVSVYVSDALALADRRRAIIFHTGGGDTEFRTTVSLNKHWILDRFQDELMLGWNLDAGRGQTKNMSERSTGSVDEGDAQAVRCAFHEWDIPLVPDVAAVAAAIGETTDRTTQQGLWLVVKKILRQILPRDRKSAQDPTTYLAGAGLGGMHAAVASMFIASEREDNMKLPTYLFASPGFECAARQLWTGDVSPWRGHDQIRSYSHVMDFLSNIMDRKVGTECLFGREALKAGSPQNGLCEGVIGYAGPNLLYRGAPRTYKVGNPPEPVLVPSRTMLAAQASWDACMYLTHSPWIAAMRLMSDDVLFFDGETDAGCKQVKAAEEVDRLGTCPNKDTIERETREACVSLQGKTSALPIREMIITAVSLGGCICSCGICGYCSLRRIRADSHLYAQDANMPFPCCCVRRRQAGSRMNTVVQKARARREKEALKSIKKQEGLETKLGKETTSKSDQRLFGILEEATAATEAERHHRR